MIKLNPPTTKISNEEAKQVFRQFAWALSGALQTKNPTGAKPPKGARSRPRANSTGAKRSSKRTAN